MARPRKDEADKRVQVNVRLLPRHREALTKAADAEGIPTAAMAERIISAHFDREERTTLPTRELASRIETKIAELEAEAKGKWHKNLTAWAAVSEMLSLIIADQRPEPIHEDELVVESFGRQIAAGKARAQVVENLAAIGVAVNPDTRRRRLLGLNALAAIDEPGDFDPRTWERAAIEAIPDQNLRERALELFCQLLVADTEALKAEAEYYQRILPYLEAEQQGRRIGRRSIPVRRNALLALGLDEGER